jgi:hypothetical protein
MKPTNELTTLIGELVLKTVSNRVNTKRRRVGITVAHSSTPNLTILYRIFMGSFARAY